MFTLGLTGGIASGKTTMANTLATWGAAVIDADALARQAVTLGSPALAAITQHFGPCILEASGALNRAALRHIIFTQPAAKDWLEQLLHPLIRSSIEAELALATGCYAVLVSPLLFETQQTQLVHRTLVIDLPEAQQLARAQQRDGVAAEQINAIMASQWPRDKRLASADDCLDNSGPLAHSLAQLHRLHLQYLALAHAH